MNRMVAVAATENCTKDQSLTHITSGAGGFACLPDAVMRVVRRMHAQLVPTLTDLVGEELGCNTVRQCIRIWASRHAFGHGITVCLRGSHGDA